MLMFLLQRHSLRRTVNIWILGVYLCAMIALISAKLGHKYARNIYTHLIHNALCRRWSSWQFPRACTVAVRPPALPSRCTHRKSAYINTARQRVLQTSLGMCNEQTHAVRRVRFEPTDLFYTVNRAVIEGISRAVFALIVSAWLNGMSQIGHFWMCF